MDNVRDHLITLLTEKFQVVENAIHDDATMDQLGLDSLAQVELIVSIQEDLAITIDIDEDISDVTVAQMAAHIKKLVDDLEPLS